LVIADKVSEIYYSCTEYIKKLTYQKKLTRIDNYFNKGEWYVVESALRQLFSLENTEDYQKSLNWVITRLITLAPKYPKYVFYFIQNQLNYFNIGYDEIKKAYWNNPELSLKLAYISLELKSTEFNSLLKNCHLFNYGSNASSVGSNNIAELNFRSIFYENFGLKDQALHYEKLRDTELTKIISERFQGKLDAYLVYYGENIGILSSSNSMGLSGPSYYHHFYPDSSDLTNKITILIDLIKCYSSDLFSIKMVDLLNNQPPKDKNNWTTQSSNNNKGYGTLLVKFGLFDVLSSLPSDSYFFSGKFDLTDVKKPLTSESDDKNLARRASFWRKMGFVVSKDYLKLTMKRHSSEILNFNVYDESINKCPIHNFVKVVDQGTVNL
jgi:hypothetical protein